MGRGQEPAAFYDHCTQYRPVQFRSLAEDEVCLLHEASLEIMARTGMRFYAQEALDLFKRAGASVSDGNLVRVPPHLVEWALRTVPKNITIFVFPYRCRHQSVNDTSVFLPPFEWEMGHKSVSYSLFNQFFSVVRIRI